MSENTKHNYRFGPDGGLVVRNYCAAELPKITVEIKSGRTIYRFTGSYHGKRSLSGKLLDHMASSGENDDLGGAKNANE